MQPLVNIGVTAARKAGQIIVRAMEKMESVQIQQKGLNDFATQVDRASEEVIIQIIKKAYPDHDILGEEGGLLTGNKEVNGTNRFQSKDNITWVIDPLDGTTNYIHGFPQFSISIGVLQNNRIEHGIIYDPLRDELFTASRGRGAQLNGKRLRVTTADLDGALLGTGFPFRNMDHLEKFLSVLRKLCPTVAGIRRAGSAALDLAYVACGRFDGFWECDLKIWDIVAGALLIREAGGIVTSYDGSDDFLESGYVVAGNPKIHKSLMQQLQIAYPEFKVE